MLKRYRVMVLLLVVGVILFLLLLFAAGIDSIISTLKNAKLEFIPIGLALISATLLVRAAKWTILFKTPNRDIKFREVLPLYLITQVVGNMTPVKAGEMVAPFIFKKRLDTTIGRGFSVLIIDRVIELSFLIGLMFVGISYLMLFHNFPQYLFNIFAISLFILLTLLILLFLLFISKKTFVKFIVTLRKYLDKHKLSYKALGIFSGEVDSFYSALGVVKNKKIFCVLISLTAIGWLLDLSAFYFVISSVFTAPVPIVASIQVISIGVAFASFIPAGIGSGAVSFVYTISSLGYPVANATAGTVLSKFFLMGLVFFYGFLSIVLLNTTKRREKA